MPFTRLAFKKVWTNSADFPTYEGSETQVRADMQYHPDAIAKFINEVFFGELEGENGTALIGAGAEETLKQVLLRLQQELDNHGEDIKNLSAGDAPESVRSAVVGFTEDMWVETEEGGYQLVIPSSEHKRMNEAFGFKLELELTPEEGYDGTAWCVHETRVVMDADTKALKLDSAEPYAGRIVVFGV